MPHAGFRSSPICRERLIWMQDFFRSRFGEPAAWLQENDRAVSWFYPKLGLSVLIDDEAREVLEYQPPRDFVMPEGVNVNPAAR